MDLLSLLSHIKIGSGISLSQKLLSPLSFATNTTSYWSRASSMLNHTFQFFRLRSQSTVCISRSTVFWHAQMLTVRIIRACAMHDWIRTAGSRRSQGRRADRSRKAAHKGWCRPYRNLPCLLGTNQAQSLASRRPSSGFFNKTRSSSSCHHSRTRFFHNSSTHTSQFRVSAIYCFFIRSHYSTFPSTQEEKVLEN